MGDYGTYSKSVSGEREAGLNKFIFFLTALLDIDLQIISIEKPQYAVVQVILKVINIKAKEKKT